jgi:hypothetical protein
MIDTDTGLNSWADIVDTEISVHIENRLLTSSSCDSSGNAKRQGSETQQYNIADIVSKDPATVDAVTLLEWQTYLSSYLKKYIKQCSESSDNELDYELHIPKFEWMAKASKSLSNKFGLANTSHKISNYDLQKGIIPRSSYKFCEYNYECQFNYKEKSGGCYAQHFVHNLVYADISSVIHYLKFVHESNKHYNYNELTKCITTISYVIKHMYEELSNLQFHYGNINTFCSGKTCKKTKNRKNFK